MKLTDFIDFKKIVLGSIEEARDISKCIHKIKSVKVYIDEEIPKKYVSPNKTLINESFNYKYVKMKDIYLEPLIKNYNDSRKINKKIYHSNIPDITLFISDSDNDTDNSDTDTDNSDTDIISGTTKITKSVIKKSAFYRSTDDKMIIFYFDIMYDTYSDFQMLGLFDTENNKFIFCGNIGMHPYIITNNFIYDNSDGSGPDISKMINCEDSDTIISRLNKYFTKFCKDLYH